jgi:RNA polymerase sigma-70 factor (ECF subfamily)
MTGQATSAPPTDIERLYRDQAGRLWRSLMAYCGDADMAADTVAETFTLALEHWGSIRSPERWIWRVGFRLATRELKRRGRVPDRTEETTIEQDLPERLIDLLVALRALSPHQRGAVILHDYAGYSALEAAMMLGSTAAAIRVHLMRGRRRLRLLLEEPDE